MESDTIYAQASALGRAGVSVVRISGPNAFAAAERLSGGKYEPRTAALRWVRDPETGEPIDRGLVLRFPGPASFTGEDVVELHLHGSPAVVRQVLRKLGTMPGLRLAEPGEFTRRAILNGKMDVVQAEGLGDLLAAETEAQRRQAMQVIGGRLSDQAHAWREILIRVLALLEVSIDFADEEVPHGVLDEVTRLIEQVRREMEDCLAGSSQAARLKEGFEVAIVGAPNAGKSTLLNFLAGRDAALTSPLPGTTRDVIEVRYDLAGLPVTFLDTAGIREATDEIEKLGVTRAVERARRADVRIYLRELNLDLGQFGPGVQPEDLQYWTKADLRKDGSGISGLTGAGVPEMLEELRRVLEDRVAGASLVAHERQMGAIEDASASLAKIGLARLQVYEEPELYSEYVRSALVALDHLVGRFDIDAVFDQIFRNFCLGK
jgi:tRNA modification GTPase